MPEQSSVYGMSCVENQTLFLLRTCGWDISRLYSHCAIPLRELFYLFVRCGLRYERFERIPRIHQQLREEGLLSITKREDGAKETAAAARGAGWNQAVLMMVDTVFARCVLHARGLRDDHYVRLLPDGDGFRLRNDLPETEAFLRPEELASAYAGRYLFVQVIRANTPADDRRRWERRIFRAEDLEPFYLEPDDMDDTEDLARRLRDMAGIYKLTRYQMRAYYAHAMDTSFMDATLLQAEKRYAQFEYCNLRREKSRERLFALLRGLNEEDVALTKRLRAGLETAGIRSWDGEVHGT